MRQPPEDLELQELEARYQQDMRGKGGQAVGARAGLPNALRFETESAASRYAGYLTEQAKIPAKAFQTEIRRQSQSFSNDMLWSVSVAGEHRFAAGLLYELKAGQILYENMKARRHEVLAVFRKYLRARSLELGRWQHDPCSAGDFEWLSQVTGCSVSELQASVDQSARDFSVWHGKERRIGYVISAAAAVLFVVLGATRSFTEVWALIMLGASVLFLLFALTRQS